MTNYKVILGYALVAAGLIGVILVWPITLFFFAILLGAALIQRDQEPEDDGLGY